MIDFISKFYAYCFAKKIFRKFNLLIYHLGLRGLGVLNFGDEYLSGERAWLRGYLGNRTRPVVLDIGANVGKYSQEVFLANPGAKVFAFEPHPVTYQALVRNLQNDNFRSYNLGVGAERGTLELYDYAIKDGSTHASFFREVITDLHRSSAISHKVDILRLDDFFLDEGLREVDLVKIDTEGYELQVLQGAFKMLRLGGIKAIQFEFNEMNIVSKASFKDFWDTLDNYRIFRLLPDGDLLEITQYSPINCEIYAYQNIIAILK